ncbi:phosphodiester glycosidase family protein [Lentzea sp. E54]|uniref:phosphodiester glycosidase family protein n=1 Tax=Lentzea xerophila TaxID=3435883 RepID=UPI003DA5E15D
MRLADGVDDTTARKVLMRHGFAVPDVQKLAVDQSPFARRIPTRRVALRRGVTLEARTIELGGGHFTNSYTLRAAQDSGYVLDTVSDSRGFHLRDALVDPAAVGAINGSFTFISDDPDYQPAEPHFDLCVRHCVVAGLPSATKPALLVHGSSSTARTVRAKGVIRVGSDVLPWAGAKEPGGRVLVFNAANCRVKYLDSDVTAFQRIVEPATNTTPGAASAVDAVVAVRPDGHAVITALVPGGGADLFAGSYVLRAHEQDAREWRVGDRVVPLTVDGTDLRALSSATSLGPSVADAVVPQRIANAYDDSLGVSPFRGVRYPRSLVYGTGDGAVHLRIFDGAPLTSHFQGLTPGEVVEVLAEEGHDLRWAFHLDGGQSSKLAYRHDGGTEVAGSLHYLVWPQKNETRFRWNGLAGRVLASCLVLREAG